MTKPASLDRLRDISKQRSIRKPLAVDEEADLSSEQARAGSFVTVEWPIGR
jgi:hypothetical protein